MKTPIVILLLGVGLLAATGCQNFEHRMKQKAALVATLDDATQARLRAGEIRIGDSEDLVYLARGKPDEKKLTTTASGETTTWVYNRYWQEYRGETAGGFQPRVRRDPTTGATTTYMEPVYRPVYSDRTQAVLRVTFTDGKVSAIERPQS
jgi:hypothetical protein